LWAVVPGAEINFTLSAQYGVSVLPQRNVYEWITVFKNGRTILTDQERSGSLSTSITEENIERVLVVIMSNRRVAVDEVAHYLRISHGFAYGSIQDQLGSHRVVQVAFQINS
jgi:hypothetical protein